MTPLRLRYRTLEFGDSDIHLRTLRDNQQFSDPDQAAEKLGVSSASWPLFGILWDSGQVLANLMFEHIIDGKRILEVGCGIALASLVLNQRSANITATDYNPAAGLFLQKNVALNDERPIPFIRTNWAEENADLGLFDLIIGSDLLYEPDHVVLLSNFINRHAKADCEVIIVDPGRGLHAKFSKKMVHLGYSHSQSKPDTEAYLKQPFRGQVLVYQRHDPERHPANID